MWQRARKSNRLVLMEKPTVFLSHSSLDKAPLAALKKLLDTRAAGSLNFFLSSDGESIRFGRNWVVRISDALSSAKLMFLFLSPHSADSKWIHFEAGCAYAKDIQVVPVCFPGIDLDQIRAPLNLLQGFNMHSHEAMGNIARICNDTFSMKINESFSREDFDSIISQSPGHGAGFFGNQARAVLEVRLNSQGSLPTDDFNPIPALLKICETAGMNSHANCSGAIPGNIKADLEQPGCTVDFNNYVVPQERSKKVQTAQENIPIQRLYRIDCTLSPEMYAINAKLFDQWLEETRFAKPLSAIIQFRRDIIRENQRESFTSKLFHSGVRLLGNDEFEFEGLKFWFDRNYHVGISFQLDCKLIDERLPRLVESLFKSSVLWEREPDLSEML